jgi:hypothetical protein
LPEVQRLPNQKLPVFPDLLATWASLHGQVAWASGSIQKKQRNIQIDISRHTHIYIFFLSQCFGMAEREDLWV